MIELTHAPLAPPPINVPQRLTGLYWLLNCLFQSGMKAQEVSVAVNLVGMIVDIISDWIAWAFNFQYGQGPLDKPSPALKWAWLSCVGLCTIIAIVYFLICVYGCYNSSDSAGGKYFLDYVNGWIEVAITVIIIVIYHKTSDCSPSDGRDALRTYSALIACETINLFVSLIFCVIAVGDFNEMQTKVNEKVAWCLLVFHPSWTNCLMSLGILGAIAHHMDTYAYGTTTTSVWYTEQPNSIYRNSNIPQSVELASLRDIINAGNGGLEREHISVTVDGITGNRYLLRFDSHKVYYSYTSLFCNTTSNYTNCSCTEQTTSDDHLFLGFRNEGTGTVYEMYCPEANSKPIYDDTSTLFCLNSTEVLAMIGGSGTASAIPASINSTEVLPKSDDTGTTPASTNSTEVLRRSGDTGTVGASEASMSASTDSKEGTTSASTDTVYHFSTLIIKTKP